MSNIEYQNLLAAATSMNEREAAGHYYTLSEQWYHLQNNKAFKAFSKHLSHIIKLLESKDKDARLDAIRTLAFISTCPRLHRQLFEGNVLKMMVHMLSSSSEVHNCEAALVVLNHLCTQSAKDQKHQFSLITDFCKDKTSLVAIFRYAHVEDTCLSIIANTMSLLAALCTERPNIQEHCVRAGIMKRAFNLKSSHRDRIVRTNTDLFLASMQLKDYSVEKFNEMHTLMCINMGYSSCALCLAIWRLTTTNRYHDALKTNTLYTAVHQISIEDPGLKDEWNIASALAVPDKSDDKQLPSNNYNTQLQYSKHLMNDIVGEYEEKKEKGPYELIRNPSLIKANNANLSFDNNISLQSLNPSKSWLEKDIHIAILQSNPIESSHGVTLAANAERKRLQDIFFKTARGIKILFGVLTKNSLIQCIRKGVQMIHISGQIQYEKQLKVEDKYGKLEALTVDTIREVMEQTNENGLKLVFVSTCHSKDIAQLFCDAGVPHVVAVHSQVQILDQMATKFASAFYE
eukprot:272823_1